MRRRRGIHIAIRCLRNPSSGKVVAVSTEAKATVSLYDATLSSAPSVGDAPAFSSQPIAHIHVASPFTRSQAGISTFDQATVGDKPDTVAFIGQIRPDSVVEDVILDGIDSGRQSNDGLSLTPVLQRRCVDAHRTDMVEMWMRDEE